MLTKHTLYRYFFHYLYKVQKRMSFNMFLRSLKPIYLNLFLVLLFFADKTSKVISN